MGVLCFRDFLDFPFLLFPGRGEIFPFIYDITYL